MSTGDQSRRLLERLRSDDEQAAKELFDLYLHRLLALVRSKLSKKLARRLDPEDVVQSAYRSFFSGARRGKYVHERSGDLWRLLAAITLHRLAKKVELHRAARRNVLTEQSARGPGSTSYHIAPEALAAAPSPAEAAALVDEVEFWMRDLDGPQRQMLEMRLVGHTLEEIAAALCRSERTVRRLFEKLRGQMHERLLEYTGP